MKIIFHPQVKDDIGQLDGNLKKRFKKALMKIKRAPELGKPLGHKSNLDLSNCRKMYFYKKKYRIVYEFINDEKILIWAVGKREAEVVYMEAYRRMINFKNNDQ